MRVGDKVFLKCGIGVGQLYKIERIVLKRRCEIKGLTGIYRGGSKITNLSSLHQPKKGYEWLFLQPSKILDMKRLIKELAGGEEWEQKKYLEDLKKFAPIVYRRFKKIKICNECRGTGGYTENVPCSYSAVSTLGGERVMPIWRKCPKCGGKRILGGTR